MMGRGGGRLRGIWNRYGKYGLCAGAGIVLFFLAELVDLQEETVENGILRRNPCGKGDAVYEFYVDGLEEGQFEAFLTVPDQKLKTEEFHERVPEMTETLCSQILGDNLSLSEVRDDLNLVKEIPEYGVSVSWESEKPELVSHMGLVNSEGVSEDGEELFLKAEFVNGGDREDTETVEIPIRVLPAVKNGQERLLEELNALVSRNREEEAVVLPETFGEWALTYKKKSHSQNAILILLGIAAAGCLYLKEKNALEEEKKKREDSLIADYPDLISGFLVLTGAGYSVKQAWKKLIYDHKRPGASPGTRHPVYEEMEITLNQMEAGTPEIQAYADFGRRCGLRCYMKFASLLESCIQTGGKNLRKLLLPMFGMLGIVMIMVVAPAFLSLG